MKILLNVGYESNKGDNLGYVHVNRKIILKRIIRKLGVRWTGCTRVRVRLYWILENKLLHLARARNTEDASTQTQLMYVGQNRYKNVLN
jgi:hypothetical protein